MEAGWQGRSGGAVVKATTHKHTQTHTRRKKKQAYGWMYFTETAAGRNDKGATPRPNQGGGTASQAGTRGATSPLGACTGEQRPRSGGEGKKKEKKMGRRHIQYRATHRSEAQRPREECNQGRERNGGGQCGRKSYATKSGFRFIF